MPTRNGLARATRELLHRCPYGDNACPCPDGDPCHYEATDDTPAMPPPIERLVGDAGEGWVALHWSAWWLPGAHTDLFSAAVRQDIEDRNPSEYMWRREPCVQVTREFDTGLTWYVCTARASVRLEQAAEGERPKLLTALSPDTINIAEMVRREEIKL